MCSEELHPAFSTQGTNEQAPLQSLWPQEAAVDGPWLIRTRDHSDQGLQAGVPIPDTEIVEAAR